MILNNRSQGVAVVDSVYPPRQLSVPEESVATNELAVGLSKVYNGVSVREGELITICYVQVSFLQLLRRRIEIEEKLTLNSIPLHAVLAGNLPKAVLDNGGQWIVVEMVVIDLGSKVELSLGLKLVV